MKIDTAQPFQIIYSIYRHEYLGYLVEPYAVQQNDDGKLTLQYQNISSKNTVDFKPFLQDVDYEIITHAESIQQVNVYKKFNSKKCTLPEFFLKTFDPEKGDKLLAEAIRKHVGHHRSQLFRLLESRGQVYEMALDMRPHGTALQFVSQPAQLTLVIEKLSDESKYYPIIHSQGKIVNLSGSKAAILSDSPVYLLNGAEIIKFESHIDSGKIKPFINKPFISIPAKFESDWYKKFVKNAILTHQIEPVGFEIKHLSIKPKLLLELEPILKTANAAIFLHEEDVEPAADYIEELKISQYFEYGKHTFLGLAENEKEVFDEWEGGRLQFTVIHRNKRLEKELLSRLQAQGLSFAFGKCKLPVQQAIKVISDIKQYYAQQGIELEIRQNTSEKQYFFGHTDLKVELTENTDWFDVKAKAVFGKYEIPFAKIRKLILNNISEFQLPDGSIAVIPTEWFEDYRDLFGLCQVTDDDDSSTGKMELCFTGLLQNWHQEKQGSINLSSRVKQLLKIEQPPLVPPSENLRASLREYQQYGLNWLHQLHTHKLGALLADDMGLGKTLQTLAFLQTRKEMYGKGTTLLVVPTSLVFNWVDESRKFTPDLSIHVQTGINRLRQVPLFSMFDLVITTYGIVRQDIAMLSQLEFDYVVFDEAQALKNPASQIYKCAQQLKAKNRIALTGTPVENSTVDLWAIMNLLNPGLLGSKKYFKYFYQSRIERKSDEQQLQRLKKIVSPFILRRTKMQVAKDLPGRVDQLLSCMMTDAQAEYYRKAKDTFRNLIIEQSIKGGGQRQILILQGLTKLRQIANHPGMVDKNYTGGAGKMDDVKQKLLDVLEEGHKVLIFSSFKEHLNFVKQMLIAHGIKYAMLTGDTTNREQVIKEFKQNHEVNVFLITIKAGGVGLNLAEADYVFILDPWWNPASEEQAVSRAHRIGQFNNVFVYRFIAKDTIEEKIFKMQQRKQKLADDLIQSEENFVKALTDAEVEELFS